MRWCYSLTVNRVHTSKQLFSSRFLATLFYDQTQLFCGVVGSFYIFWKNSQSRQCSQCLQLVDYFPVIWFNKAEHKEYLTSHWFAIIKRYFTPFTPMYHQFSKFNFSNSLKMIRLVLSKNHINLLIVVPIKCHHQNSVTNVVLNEINVAEVI